MYEQHIILGLLSVDLLISFVGLFFVVKRKTWREYTNTEGKKIPLSTGHFEYLVENFNGDFAPTGELIPDNQDPHDAAVRRSELEGISYSSSKIK